ncbi:hypothetical protein [Lentzea waywayandensis]|uniref:hypothetical protein n=1 Tax=Lentzea waywayandensis TaxID=84724 RepID=UPI000B811C87|nr:hypothetical protein [Lentzea waywayandensis]
MNEFGLTFEPHDVVHEDVIVPLIDGVPLTEWLELHDDPSFSGVRREDLDAEPFRPGKAKLVLGCDCGIASCGPLVARITADGTTIVWDSFRRPHRGGRVYDELGPFRFDRADYEKLVLELG